MTAPPEFLPWDAADPVCPLSAQANLLASVHVFTEPMVDAVNAALASGRPLLVRGEPGTGKSQLARAAAERLRRPFLSFVVDARTEARDLQYRFDAVARLAEAQIQGALAAAGRDEAELRAALAEACFLSPQALWWAFDWEQAKAFPQGRGSVPPPAPAGWQAAHGVVLLIDEIDKADSAVPNGLLECLGQGRFPLPGGGEVSWQPQATPLVVVTTNEERTLPDAFLRRCWVLHLGWPAESAALRAELVHWGRAHFPALEARVLERAAELLERDRRAADDLQLNPPGGAEYLDLLRALDRRYPGDAAKQLAWLEATAGFALRKHPELHRQERDGRAG
jgi:MoxR-like ATPase